MSHRPTFRVHSSEKAARKRLKTSRTRWGKSSRRASYTRSIERRLKRSSSVRKMHIQRERSKRMIAIPLSTMSLLKHQKK